MATDCLLWPGFRSDGYVWPGAAILEAQQGDELEYRVSLRIPPVMKLKDARERAPTIFTEMNETCSGAALLTSIERHLREIAGPAVFVQRWPDGLSVYAGLEPERLRLFARRLAAFGISNPKELAAVSIMVYAVLGLAEDREFAMPTEDNHCSWCYQTALSPSKYCAVHRISRQEHLVHTKKRGNAENLDVVRRRARRIREIADDLRKDERGIYRRLFCQLQGITSEPSAPLPPLEEMHDDKFAIGQRVGMNGSEWFIYLWKVLPRMQKVLGADWPELVRSALELKDWSQVLQRLGRIDPYKEDTDAFKWAWTLIEAEGWAEAEEIERQQRHRGRPCKSKPDPKVEYALRQVRDGKRVADAAGDVGVSQPTLYRWEARTEPATTSAVATERR